MQLTTLTEVIRGESYWIVDRLLEKRSSILLSGGIADTSLLALQLALDVAAGKPFLGEYSTSLGKVLFIEKDKLRLQAHGQALGRRPAGTDNVSTMLLDPGDEREIVRVMTNENPLVTVLGNFPGSLDHIQLVMRVGPVIAIGGNEWIGSLPVNDMWSLQCTETGYRLAVKPQGIALNLSKGENGFVLEGVEDWKPGSGPVWSTAKSLIKRGSPSLSTGMKMS